MIRLRVPVIVDAATSSGLPGGPDAVQLVIDFEESVIFAAEGYAWLGRLLAAGHRIRIEHASEVVLELVRMLVPAGIVDGELVRR